MRILVIVPLTLAAVVAALLLLQLTSGPETEAAEQRTIVSVFGVADVQGEPVFVHISAVVGPGQNPDVVADAMLRAQDARRVTPQDLDSAAYATNVIVWGQFTDADPGNDFVTQYYNSSGEPSGINGQTALTNTHNTWTNVASSSFAFSGGSTTRCPSLVDECSGFQFEDGFNDVTFLSIKGPCNAVFGCTLGVTWYTPQEADVAFNTKVSWIDDCDSSSGDIDIETVALHENGHVVGLSHSTVDGSIMLAFYGGENCSLGQDDVDGVTFLYPSTGTPVPTATPGGPTATPTDPPPPSPTPSVTATPSSTSVIVDDISYSTSGGRESDKHLNITISLIDGDGLAVGGASVSIDLYRDTNLYAAGTGSTDTGGIVTFTATNAPSGCYDVDVTDVTAAGLSWDSSYPANGFPKGAAC